jgi:hypothetical protein
VIRTGSGGREANGHADRRLLGALTLVDQTAYPDRAGFCSVAGDTHPFTGVAIPVGTFLDLLATQPSNDSEYLGATPAIFVDGKGLTCDPPPPGYVRPGLAGDAEHTSSGIYPCDKAL